MITSRSTVRCCNRVPGGVADASYLDEAGCAQVVEVPVHDPVPQPGLLPGDLGVVALEVVGELGGGLAEDGEVPQQGVTAWSSNVAGRIRTAATGYNLVAVPLAAGVLAFAGVLLPPALGAVLMSASTIVVAANAQLLRRTDLRPAAAETGTRPSRTPRPRLRRTGRRRR